MSILSYFVEHYIVTAIAACAFLLFIRLDCTESDRSMRNFFNSTVCILILILVENLDYCLSTLPKPTLLREITSVIGYTVRPMIAYFVAVVPARDERIRNTWVLAAPLVINCLFAATSFFCPIAFYFDENNAFHRGPLGYVTFAISAYYVVVLVVLGWQRTRHGERQEAVICIVTALLAFGSAYLESAFGYVGRLAAVSLMGQIYYFMHLLMTKYSSDQLTGAYVRKHLYRDVEGKSAARYYITFDVNGLKRINDRYGHAAGDRALISFSDNVRRCLPAAAKFYRLGGDEFAIIYRTTSVQDVTALMKLICSLCKTLPYGVSGGYASFIDGKDFDRASAKADEMLYAEKRAFWNDYAAKHTEEMEASPSRR